MPDPAAEDQALSAYLADRDVPCPGCGYNLRGLTADRCPECSQALKLSVSLQEAHLSALLAAILPPIAIAGAAGVLLIVVFMFTVGSGRTLPSGEEATIFLWMPLAASLLLGVPALWLALPTGRAWFRSRSWRVRANTVAASVLASLAMLGLYLALLARLI